jgi:hypothetical protein
MTGLSKNFIIGIDPTKPDPLKAVTDWYSDDTFMNTYDGKNICIIK